MIRKCADQHDVPECLRRFFGIDLFSECAVVRKSRARGMGALPLGRRRPHREASRSRCIAHDGISEVVILREECTEQLALAGTTRTNDKYDGGIQCSQVFRDRVQAACEQIPRLSLRLAVAKVADLGTQLYAILFGEPFPHVGCLPHARPTGPHAFGEPAVGLAFQQDILRHLVQVAKQHETLIV